MFCEYSDIFGNPNEGVHSYRLFNVAIVDVGLTILVAYLLSIWVGGNKFGLILIIFLVSRCGYILLTLLLLIFIKLKKYFSK